MRYIIKAIPSNVTGYQIRRVIFNLNEYKVSTNEEASNEIRVEIRDSDKDITEQELLANYYPSKSTLVINAIIQCLQDEQGFTQRWAFDFLMSHMPLASDILSFDEKVCLIEASCLLLKKKKIESIIRRLYIWVFGHIKEKEETQETISGKNDVALKAFVKAVKKLFSVVPKDKDSAKAPIQIVKMVFDDNDCLVEKLLPEFASTIVRYLETYQKGYSFSEDLMVIGKQCFNNDKQLILIWQALGSELSELMGEQNYIKVLETIKLIKFFLKAYDLSKEEFASKSKYLKPIFARILNAMGSLSSNLSIMANAIPGLNLISDILAILESDMPVESSGHMADGIKKFVAFYVQFLNHLMESKFEKDEESWKNVEEAFALTTKNIVEIQIYVDSQREGTEWLDKLVKCAQEPNIQSEITLHCIEGILNIFEKAKKNSTYKYLQSCVQNEGEIIEKLWDMIGQSPNDRKVVELIIKANDVMFAVLMERVNKQLVDRNIQNAVTAINRFALFWKLSAEYYPKFVPFKHENIPVETPCVFHIIDYLSVDHPLLRHSSKSWLVESNQHLDRILDPTINRLFDSKMDEAWDKGSGRLIHNREYETRYVIDAFKKLRNILTTNRADLMAFMMNTVISSDLQELYDREKAKQLCTFSSQKLSYLQLLIFLCIKYIRGQVAESITGTFATENAAVNASGCEFLELIITSVEPPEKAPEVAAIIVEPLLIGLYNALLSKDNVMQVEILKLIRLIQKCTAITACYANNCRKIFSSTMYKEILEGGLRSEISYVRSYYITYVTFSLPLYTTFMVDQLNEIVMHLIKCYCKNLSICSAVSVVKDGDAKKIANENDILQILGGVKELIHFFFFAAEKELDKQDRIDLQKLIGLPSGKKAKLQVEEARTTMLTIFGDLFFYCLHIWKQPDPKCIKNFKLSYNGILSYGQEEYSKTLSDFSDYLKTALSEKEYTNYQRAFTLIIGPVIEKYPSKTF